MAEPLHFLSPSFTLIFPEATQFHMNKQELRSGRVSALVASGQLSVFPLP